jgi:hypothetical protein
LELVVTDIELDANRCDVELHPLTDLHIDDPDHAADHLARRIAHIRDTPNAYWVGCGDYGSLILPGDPRFGSGGHLRDEWREHLGRLPDFYLERCHEILSPIADKCLGLAAGNHEATVGKHYHRGLVPELAMSFGRPELYLGDRGWSILKFHRNNRKTTLSAFVYHGWSTGRLKGRKHVQAERDLGAWAADVFFLGHDHQPAAALWYTQEAYGSKSGWALRDRPRAHVNGGSWGYGQKPPTPMREKSKWKPHTAPGQSWVEGKNFRPDPPSNPYVIVHVDSGDSKRESFRPAGFDLEIRWTAQRHHYGDESIGA